MITQVSLTMELCFTYRALLYQRILDTFQALKAVLSCTSEVLRSHFPAFSLQHGASINKECRIPHDNLVPQKTRTIKQVLQNAYSTPPTAKLQPPENPVHFSISHTSSSRHFLCCHCSSYAVKQHLVKRGSSCRLPKSRNWIHGVRTLT